MIRSKKNFQALQAAGIARQVRGQKSHKALSLQKHVMVKAGLPVMQDLSPKRSSKIWPVN